MARDFNGTTDKLQADAAPATGFPITMAAWFNADDDTVNGHFFSLIDPADVASRFSLAALGAVAGDPVQWQICGGATCTNPRSSTGYTAGQWHHACGISRASNDHSVFLDGGSEATSANDETPPVIERVGIGALVDDTPVAHFNGKVAEAAIWTRALSDEEVAGLAAGYSPLFFPQNLVFYAPLIRGLGDRAGGLTLTATGTSVAKHFRIRYPAPLIFAVPAAAAANVFNESLTFGLGLAETFANTQLMSESLTFGLGLADTVNRAQNLNESLTFGLGLGDTYSAQVTYAASLSFGLGLGDTVSPMRVFTESLTFGLGLDDAFSAVRSFDASITEGLGLSDAYTGAITQRGWRQAGDESATWTLAQETSATWTLVDNGTTTWTKS